MSNIPNTPNPAASAKAAEAFAGIAFVLSAIPAIMREVMIETAPTTNDLSHMGPIGGVYVILI